MKKLLFTGLMGFGFVLKGAEEQGPRSKQDIYLMDWVKGKGDFGHGKIPSIDCDKINALTAAEFSFLIEEIQRMGCVILGTREYYEIARDSSYKAYQLLCFIDRCRPVGPFIFNQKEIEEFKTMADDQFDQWLKEAEIKQVEYNATHEPFTTYEHKAEEIQKKIEELMQIEDLEKQVSSGLITQEDIEQAVLSKSSLKADIELCMEYYDRMEKASDAIWHHEILPFSAPAIKYLRTVRAAQ